MSHEHWVMGAAGLLFGLLIGFMLGVWKAAKMQALREAQQAHLAGVQEAIKRGTRIVNPVPMPSPRQRPRAGVEPTKPW